MSTAKTLSQHPTFVMSEYSLAMRLNEPQKVYTHEGAEFVKVAFINGFPHVWSLGDGNSKLELRTLVIREQDAEIGENEHYVGTFFIDNTSSIDKIRGEHGHTFVYHVWEVKG